MLKPEKTVPPLPWFFKPVWILGVFFFLSVNGLLAGEMNLPAKRAIAIFTKTPPKIDGRVDKSWLEAPAQNGFIQNRPEQGKPARFDTYFYVMYDNQNIYFLFIMLDSNPDNIPVRLVDRDHDFDPYDNINFYLDTYNDQRNAYYFSTNPMGVERDGLISENGRVVDLSWDGIFKVAARKNEHGWVAEFEIPFKTLRFNSNLQYQIWGLNVWRVRNANHELSYWSLVDQNYQYMVRLDKGGVLIGPRDIRPGNQLHIQYYRNGRENWIGSKNPIWESQEGLDIKYGITSNLTLDFTLNPDFGQVEIDEEQINLDKRLEIQYPEKRPFFLENKNLFDIFPFQLFYSRRIGALSDIKTGAKLTGKVGGWTLGVLNAFTGDWKRFGLGDPKNDTPDEIFNIIRVKRDVLRSSNIGFTFADRQVDLGNKDNYRYNHAGGMDWNLFLGKYQYFSGQMAFSSNYSPKSYEPNGKGWAGYGQFGHYDRLFHLNVQAMHFDADFDINGTGFFAKIPQKGRDQVGMYADIHPFLNKKLVRSFRLSTFGNFIKDSDETKPGYGVQNTLFVQLQDLSYLQLGATFYHDVESDYLYYPDSINGMPPAAPMQQLEYSGRDLMIKIQTDQGKALSAFLKWNFDTQYYFQTHTTGYNRRLDVGVRIQPISNGFLEFEYKRTQFLDQNLRELPLDRYGQTDVHLYILKGRYLFTKNIFSRFFIQYTNNADTIVWGGFDYEKWRFLPTFIVWDRLSANVLLGWRFLPGSTIYLAYTEEWDNRFTAKLKSANRIVFFKFSYLWSL